MPQDIVATRRFSTADQEVFAVLSGDCNPMHMDPMAARRTQAGAPVVHGIHLLLWSLDTLARRYPDLPAPATLKVRFDKFVYVGDTAQLILERSDAAGLQIAVAVEGIVTMRAVAGFAAAPGREPPAPPPAGVPVHRPGTQSALDLSWEELADQRGYIPFAVPSEEVGARFPDAARAWGARRVAALACSSFLVGMVCPGLHSIFGGLAINLTADDTGADGLFYRVTTTDPRFRLVRMSIAGGGLAGSIDSFARHPPAAQPAMASLAGLVRPGEFAGATALVVGGSRGLGELTAKLLAAGGAQVIATYAAGRADAARLQQEIAQSGGHCEILPYDVRGSAEQQLAQLSAVPSQLYYFATPAIFRRKSGLFVAERFAEFLAFYVHGFYDLCQELRRRRPAGISVFYPSSVAVEERPADMTEYAMAKMAGEVLCRDMRTYQQPIAIAVDRLPRLPTDQTATLREVATADPCAVMLPILREVHARQFPG